MIRVIRGQVFLFLGSSSYNSLPLEFAVSAKIHEQCQSIARGVQIVKDLRAMLICQSRYGFDLHDHVPKADEIRLKPLTQWLSRVAQWQRRLRLKWYALHAEFKLQAFLINRFREPVSLLVVNLKTGSNNPVALLFV